MEANKSKTGLHPLMTAAAISVTVFSAVGVGAMTGLLPHSFGSSKEAAQLSSNQSQPTVDSLAAAAANSDTASMPPASAASTPAPKPAHKAVKKHVVAHATSTSAPAPDFSSAPPPPPPGLEPQAQAPVAPQPVAAGSLGVVESVREVSTPAKTSNGVGPIAGGIAGAVLGNQVGHGDGRTIATVLGAAAGAFGGRAIEQNVRATKHWEITVRLDDGSTRTVSSPSAPIWHGGERIRLLDGTITPA